MFKEIIVSLMLLVLVNCSLYAQANFSGPYQVGEYRGKAEFSYQLVEEDTVFNGPFEMQYSNLQNLFSKQDHYFSFQGAFQNDIPQGPWSFKFGEFTVDITEDLKVNNYRYEVKTKGTYHDASGDILAGRPHGIWTQTIQEIKASQVEETLFKSTIDFVRGIPQKGFRIQNDRLTLMGRFLRDGLAHDVWEVYGVEAPGAIESWYFSEGRLDRIVFKDNDSTITIPIYASNIENSQVINLDDRYLEVIKLNHRLATGDSVEIRGEMNRLLTENAILYRKLDNILVELGESQFMPEFKVRVNNNPLKMSELNHLDSIKASWKLSERISRELLQSTQLNILKLSDSETLFLLSVVGEIAEKQLVLLQEVTEFYDQNILSFVQRENMFVKLWPNVDPTTDITVTYEEADSMVTRSYTGPNAGAYKLAKDGIAGIYQLAKYVSGCMVSIQSRINEKLTKEQKQQELMTLEEALIAEVTALNNLVDSLRGETTGEIQNALNKVKQAAKQELSEYSAMEDMSRKPDQARLLTNCFNQMQDLSLTITTHPVRSNEIKETYIDEVWNPFTATLMNEEVKKHILEAYEKILVPYVFNQLKNDLSCSNAAQLKVLMDTIHRRMLELRDEDTNRLERKLKREGDPLTIMQLFNIQTESAVDGL